LLFGQILSITQPFAPRYNRNLKEIMIVFIIVCQEDFKAARQLETAIPTGSFQFKLGPEDQFSHM
jgi:hypothetical protein